MLKRSSRCKAGARTILDALHSRGVYFHIMREKPVLLERDIKARKKFARDYHKKPGSWWASHIQLHIDVKMFKVYLTHEARERAAKMAVRGAYRAKKQGLGKAYVKPSKTLKFNAGAQGVRVLAGVGPDKVLVWEYLEKNKWNGGVAAAMYTGPVKKALQRTFPQRKYFNVLEDNDPSGFLSAKGIAAKVDARIRPFHIPPRSPQLNVCDYALWALVNTRMRAQERNFPKSKKETRGAFLDRLRRTALGLPREVVANCVKDLRRRCGRLLTAKGGHFEEGGKGP